MLTLENINSAVLGVSLSNKSPTSDDYPRRKQILVDQLASVGDELAREPIPFYKEGDNKNPAGYVIETNKGIMVCYHGTQFGKLATSGGKEVLHDLQAYRSKMDFGGEKVLVHAGFKKEYESSKKSLYEALAKTDTQTKKVHMSGHSLGGAVAQIAALDASTNKDKTPPIKISGVSTFGGPRVFSKNAAVLYNGKLGKQTLRIKQDKDPVPKIMPKGPYHHVGKKINLSADGKGIHAGAVYLGITKKISKAHVDTARSSESIYTGKKQPKTARERIEAIEIAGVPIESYVACVKKLTKAGLVFARHVSSKIRDNKPTKEKTAIILPPKKDLETSRSR